MEILHILNDGPSQDANFIAQQQSINNLVRTVDLTKNEVSYEELIKMIDECDRVFSW